MHWRNLPEALELAGNAVEKLSAKLGPQHHDTLDAIDHYLVAIKGPLTTPVGGGIRSLRNEAELVAAFEFLDRAGEGSSANDFGRVSSWLARAGALSRT